MYSLMVTSGSREALGTRMVILSICQAFPFCGLCNLVPRACDPREGTWGSGIIRCRKPGILAKIELRISYQRPIRFLPETDYPRASCSFPRIAGSGNEIVDYGVDKLCVCAWISVPDSIPARAQPAGTCIVAFFAAVLIRSRWSRNSEKAWH
jgi:hypothetical protein